MIEISEATAEILRAALNSSLAGNRAKTAVTVAAVAPEDMQAAVRVAEGLLLALDHERIQRQRRALADARAVS